jgi:hypothetical protein
MEPFFIMEKKGPVSPEGYPPALFYLPGVETIS